MMEIPYNIIAEKTREERQYNIKNLERLELNKDEQQAVRQVVNTINKESFSIFIAFTLYSLLWGIGLVKAYKDISVGFAAVTVLGIGLGLYVAIKALQQIKNPSSFVYERAQYGKIEKLYFFNEDRLRQT